MLSPDLWLRQQLWQRLWKGPAAVSAYLSIPIQLVSPSLPAKEFRRVVISGELITTYYHYLPFTLADGDNK
jgi:hypothetical protein